MQRYVSIQRLDTWSRILKKKDFVAKFTEAVSKMTVGYGTEPHVSQVIYVQIRIYKGATSSLHVGLTRAPVQRDHRRLIHNEHTHTHADGADPRVWGLARAGLRVAWSPAISRIRDHGRSHPVLALEGFQSEDHTHIYIGLTRFHFVVALECCQSEEHVIGLEVNTIHRKS